MANQTNVLTIDNYIDTVRHSSETGSKDLLEIGQKTRIYSL